ncbi:hypothetical protein CXF68_14910 [Tenacibaculum sp. Bg11-29]|uniref:hypothetical protein n=1 Tax=Tenacibaculum sp. Bg11-29 TaxID=2058306 RepID=UPI000C345BC5|nr:hypothetical protein [Tenacibaculum sp. Bg11-29]PKH51897.1 hypothetical protein CXF68_14910 [Tenacibaculum sp. Bg11-29]
MEKVKKILPYIIAVVCTTAFFSFEYAPEFTKEYKEAKINHLEAKRNRTLALNKVKAFAKGSEVHNNYLKNKKNTDDAWSKLKKVKSNDAVFGFTNLQQFLGEFGWVFGLFIYSVFNLLRSLTNMNKEKGFILLHITLLSISIFYLYWIFQPFQDFSKFSYYLMSVLTGGIVSFSIYFMSKYKFTDIGKLQVIVRNLFDFILVDVNEKELIKEEKKEYYEKKSMELVKNALDNE